MLWVRRNYSLDASAAAASAAASAAAAAAAGTAAIANSFFIDRDNRLCAWTYPSLARAELASGFQR